MVARATCRECFARFGAVLALFCVGAATAAAQTADPPTPGANEAMDKAKEMVDPIRRCKTAEDGTITVCGSDTEKHRLSPELRAIAREGREAPPKLPRAEANAMSLDRLPYNWRSIGGRYPPGPEYNALYEIAKRATDPETGEPVVEEPD
jgi:hypothetical protein